MGIYLNRFVSNERALVFFDTRKKKTLEFHCPELDELRAQIGMQAVKDFVEKWIATAQQNQQRKRGGKRPLNMTNHICLLGNPGTGKTTVMRLLGKIAKALGFVRSGHIVELTKADFASPYVGGIDKLAADKINEALDGVLYIDETYQLAQDPSFKPVLDRLLTEMENKRERLIVAVSGYAKEMDDFFQSNPGFPSRIPEENVITIADYTVDEMVMIVQKIAQETGFIISDDGLAQARKTIKRRKEQTKHNPRDFGNGRYARNLVEEAVKRSAKRLAALNREPSAAELVTLEADDFLSLEDLRPKKTEQELLAKLDAMIGLRGVKKKVRQIIKLVRQMEAKRAANMEVADFSLHMMLLGNPGTGKTVVARIIAEILCALGVLPKGHFVEVTKEKFASTFVGGIDKAAEAILDEADGGVLFVDEAYALGQDPNFKPAIEKIMTAMENRRDRIAVILAGYEDEMNELLKVNSGLTSRIQPEFRIHFEDYSESELLEMLKLIVRAKGMILADGAEEQVFKRIKEAKAFYRTKPRDMGNGRWVRTLYEAALLAQAERLDGDTDIEAMRTLTAEDFGAGKQAGPKQTKEDLFAEMEKLVGLQSVKDAMDELYDTVAADQKRREFGQKVEPMSMHMSFEGPPGTGKTTFARLLGKMHKALGSLPSGHLVEVAAKDLIGQYVGTGTQNMKNAIEKADGGVLFIDEAYQLGLNQNQIGMEAVEVLLKEMEDRRDRMVVVVAGYTQHMKRFMALNPGLESRIQPKYRLEFPDYSDDELVEIVVRTAAAQEFVLTDAAKEAAKLALARRKAEVEEGTFGNAREARNIVEAAKQAQSRRVMKLPNATAEDFRLMIADDFGGKEPEKVVAPKTEDVSPVAHPVEPEPPVVDVDDDDDDLGFDDD